MGAYADHAERLIERGYAAIPILPGSKCPGYLCAGLWVRLSDWSIKFKNGPPSADERKNWGRGDTGVGVVCGPSSGGTVAFDIDTENPDITAAIRSVLPPSTVRKAGAKGETIFYYGPKIEKSRSWNIDGKRVLDLIGPDRQTVLPPSIHPDTKLQYFWSGTETLEDLAPGELPEVAPDIVDKISAVLAPFGYEPEVAQHARGNGHDGDAETPHRSLNNLALANLEAWVPALGLYRCRRTRLGFEAVPDWRPSSTEAAAGKAAPQSEDRPGGHSRLWCRPGLHAARPGHGRGGCDLDTAFRFLSERLNWAPDIDLSGLLQPTQPESHAPEPEPQVVGPEQRQSAEPKSKSEPAVLIDELERFTVVPGAVGDIVDWIVATSRRPSRIIALGAAITIVGTLIGRRVAGPTRSATNLYVVGVAPTGYGKQRALDSVPDLLEAAGAIDHFGSAKFFSLSAVLELMQEKPLVLCVQDEIGALLQSITNRKASNHEKAVSQILRTLWGCSFSRLPPAQWATRKMRSLHCPALSIFGASTTEEFHAALQGEQVANGFLNRFLVLGSNARNQEREPEFDPHQVPKVLAEALRALYLWSGPMSLLQIADPEAGYPPDVLPWASKQALDCYMDLVHLIEQHGDYNPTSVAYLARCSETAIRLQLFGPWDAAGMGQA